MISSLLFLILSITYPFQCLPEYADGLQHIEAREIWVENPAVWDIKLPIELVYTDREWVDTIRIYYSPSAYEYYIFVYDTEPVFNEDTYIWDWHPCAAGAITPDQYIEVMYALYDY